MKGFGYFSIVEGIKCQLSKDYEVIHNRIPYGQSQSLLSYEANPFDYKEFLLEDHINIVNLSLYGIFNTIPRFVKENTICIIHDIELLCPTFGVHTDYKPCSRFKKKPCFECSDWLGPFLGKSRTIAFRFWMDFLEKCKLIIVPSLFIKTVFDRYIKVTKKIIVEKHFINNINCTKKKNNHVMVPGLWSKIDRNIIFVIYDLLKKNIPVKVINHEGFTLPPGVKEYFPQPQNSFFNLCSDVGVCLYLSNAMESYGLVIDEMSSIGVRSVLYKSGALYERSNRLTYFVSNKNTPLEIAKVVEKVLRKESTPIKGRSKEEYCSKLIKLILRKFDER